MEFSASSFFQVGVVLVLILSLVAIYFFSGKMDLENRKEPGLPTRDIEVNGNAALYQIVISQIEKAQGSDRVVIVSLLSDYIAGNLTAVPTGTLRVLKRRLQAFNATKGEWADQQATGNITCVGDE